MPTCGAWCVSGRLGRLNLKIRPADRAMVRSAFGCSGGDDHRFRLAPGATDRRKPRGTQELLLYGGFVWLSRGSKGHLGKIVFFARQVGCGHWLMWSSGWRV
jgi:hypothetical protein